MNTLRQCQLVSLSDTVINWGRIGQFSNTLRRLHFLVVLTYLQFPIQVWFSATTASAPTSLWPTPRLTWFSQFHFHF